MAVKKRGTWKEIYKSACETTVVRVGLHRTKPQPIFLGEGVTIPMPRGYDHIGNIEIVGRKHTFITNMKVCTRKIPARLQKEIIDSLLNSSLVGKL